LRVVKKFYIISVLHIRNFLMNQFHNPILYGGAKLVLCPP